MSEITSDDFWLEINRLDRELRRLRNELDEFKTKQGQKNRDLEYRTNRVDARAKRPTSIIPNDWY